MKKSGRWGKSGESGKSNKSGKSSSEREQSILKNSDQNETKEKESKKGDKILGRLDSQSLALVFASDEELIEYLRN